MRAARPGAGAVGSAFSCGIVLLSGTGNRVTGNVARNNQPVDILNAAGPTNIFTDNVCGTSVPPGPC